MALLTFFCVYFFFEDPIESPYVNWDSVETHCSHLTKLRVELFEDPCTLSFPEQPWNVFGEFAAAKRKEP